MGLNRRRVLKLINAKGKNGNPRHAKLVARWYGDVEGLGGNQGASELDLSVDYCFKSLIWPKSYKAERKRWLS